MVEIAIQIFAAFGPLALTVMGLVVSLRPPSPQGRSRLVWMAAFALVGLPTAISTFAELRGTDSTLAKIWDHINQPILADVNLCVVGTAEPNLFSYNSSKEPALTRQYYRHLWNLSATRPSLLLTDAGQKAPLEAKRGLLNGDTPDWFPLLNAEMAKSQIKLGSHVFGWANVECPKCRARTIWVNIDWGKGGWYSEVPKGQAIPPHLEFAISKIQKDGTEKWLADNKFTIDKRPIVEFPPYPTGALCDGTKSGD